MRFSDRESNYNLISRLDRIVKEDKISHAYLFEGSDVIDKRLFAESFVKGILCERHSGENCGLCNICDKVDHQNHEDILYISADGGSIKDAGIIDMQEQLKTKPFGNRHIVIIENSDAMTLRAQNRLLKTLEEPPGNTVIILLSENMEDLTQTILSRCVKYRINDSGSGRYGFMMEKTQRIAEMALKRAPFYQLKKMLDDIIGSNEDAAALLDGLQVVYRNMITENAKGISLYKDEDLINHVYAVERARRQIKQGVSTAYALKNLMLEIGG